VSLDKLKMLSHYLSETVEIELTLKSEKKQKIKASLDKDLIKLLLELVKIEINYRIFGGRMDNGKLKDQILSEVEVYTQRNGGVPPRYLVLSDEFYFQLKREENLDLNKDLAFFNGLQVIKSKDYYPQFTGWLVVKEY